MLQSHLYTYKRQYTAATISNPTDFSHELNVKMRLPLFLSILKLWTDLPCHLSIVESFSIIQFVEQIGIKCKK